jgi:hypothetical protein
LKEQRMRRHKILPLLALLLTPAAAHATPTAFLTIGRTTPGAAVTDKILGMNMANWFDQTQTGMAAALKTGGIRAVRWPGGSASDLFHWQTNSSCSGGYVNPNATFDDFFNDIAIPDNLDVAVTLNYGSNAACTGGGDPTEAAAWVAYARAHNDPVTHWTVGNEVYGSWEYDLHPAPHDPTTYATAVATGYYPDIKEANPKALVGVVVAPGYNWDSIVLAQAKYDFVEFHYYAQAPGQESDTYLVGQASQDFATAIAAVKTDLAAAGKPNTPIYVGELGSVYANPGKQSTSITQALFAGQALGEMMNAGIARATWWLGFGGCNDASSGNFSSSLYGWQNFGGYMVFSDGTPEYGCSNATAVPLGTLLPTARAFQLFALVAKNGEHVLPVTATGYTSHFRAYAATAGAGTALVLFNTDENDKLNVSIGIAGVASSTGVTTTTYDRAIYDKSQNNIWAGPAKKSLGAQVMPLKLTLPPWSMTVVQLKP